MELGEYIVLPRQTIRRNFVLLDILGTISSSENISSESAEEEIPIEGISRSISEDRFVELKMLTFET